MADPTDAQRQLAADLRGMHTALTEAGFGDDQAVTLLCQLITPTPTRPDRSDRSARVASLLAATTGQKPPATRSPAEDRAADLWNPPATTQGAPAHD